MIKSHGNPKQGRNPPLESELAGNGEKTQQLGRWIPTM